MAILVLILFLALKIYIMKNLILLLSLIIILSACESRNSDEFSISGKIEGKFEGNVYLQKNKDGQFMILDTAVVKDGKFKFKGTIEYPNIYYIGIDEGRFVSFFNEASDIKIKFHIDSITSPEIKGSTSDNEYRSYMKALDKHKSAQIGIYTRYNEAARNNDSVQIKAIEAEMNEIDAQHKANILGFIKDNPTSFVSPYIAMRHSYELNLDELRQLNITLDPKVKESAFAKMLADRILVLENVEIGKEAPDFTMNDTQGNPVKLSDLRGKVLLVDFWASWCGPCRKENPNIVNAYKRFNEKGFDILGVSLDREQDSWLAAIKDDNLTWTHVSDLKYWNNAASKLYGVMSIPSNVLLDANGVIIARNLTGEELIKKLEELLPAV